LGTLVAPAALGFEDDEAGGELGVGERVTVAGAVVAADPSNACLAVGTLEDIAAAAAEAATVVVVGDAQRLVRAGCRRGPASSSRPLHSHILTPAAAVCRGDL
jgi:hypothetical protein